MTDEPDPEAQRRLSWEAAREMASLAIVNLEKAGEDESLGDMPDDLDYAAVASHLASALATVCFGWARQLAETAGASPETASGLHLWCYLIENFGEDGPPSLVHIGADE